MTLRLSVVLAALVFGVALPVHCQTRTLSKIDWKAADEATQADAQRDAEGLAAFRSSSPPQAEIDAVSLPVLVPGTGIVRASPRFKGQQTAYAVLYPLDYAQLTVMGSASALVVDDDSALGSAVATENQLGELDFQTSEDGADLSFSRFGASYVLRISCENPELDERCLKEEFLVQVAKELVSIKTENSQP